MQDLAAVADGSGNNDVAAKNAKNTFINFSVPKNKNQNNIFNVPLILGATNTAGG